MKLFFESCALVTICVLTMTSFAGAQASQCYQTYPTCAPIPANASDLLRFAMGSTEKAKVWTPISDADCTDADSVTVKWSDSEPEYGREMLLLKANPHYATIKSILDDSVKNGTQFMVTYCQPISTFENYVPGPIIMNVETLK